MRKEKKVKAYTRRTKSGKTVTVRAYSSKYDAAEEAKELAKKAGAGDELTKRKKDLSNKKEIEEMPTEEEMEQLREKAEKRIKKNVIDKSKSKTSKKSTTSASSIKSSNSSEPAFTAAEYKAWYHWDQAGDPKNKTALKVEKALRKQMGRKAYNEYFDKMSDNYSARGHISAFKKLDVGSGESKTTQSKPTKDIPKVDSSNEGYTIETHYRGKTKQITSPTIMRQAPGKSAEGVKYGERFLAFDTTTGKTTVHDSEKSALKYLKDVGIRKKDITMLGVGSTKKETETTRRIKK